MKYTRRPFVSIALMSSSLVLLLVFLVFWMQKVYDEQYGALCKETDTIFRTTMMDIQDSLVRKNMKLLGRDSLLALPLPPPMPAMAFRESMPGESGRVFIEKHRLNNADTLGEQHVQIYVKSNQRLDSSDKLLSSIAGNAGIRHQSGNYNFVLQLDIDSIPVQAISARYRQALAHSGIPLAFAITRITEFSPQTKVEKGIWTAPFMSFPINTQYSAYFPQYQSYLVRSCISQILFSGMLLLITSVSFFLIYRNFQRESRLNELKDDFINNITHELKTPITTVGVALEALSNFNAFQNPAQASEYLEISKHELNHLNLLVDKILKTTMFESKGIDIQWNTVDMKQLLVQVQYSMQIQYDKLHADVALKREGSEFRIKGDSVHLTNVLYNLIDNALKYTSLQPDIEIRLLEKPEKIELSIQDNGIGIEPEFQHKIFEKFFRVPTGNVHNTKGHGLGLNYVAQVVVKHNGQLSVQSKPGHGSCFTISLPKAYAEN